MSAAVGRLHRLNPEDVGDKAVSPYSKWSDRVWLFDDFTAGSDRKRVDWGRQLADGSTLLDDEWTPFLNGCRRLLWSLMTEKMVGKPFKPSTVEAWAYGLWVLVDWMSLADYRHMSELGPAAIAEYLEYLQEEKMAEDAERRFPFTSRSLKKALVPLTSMWSQAEVLEAAGVETLPERPFKGRSASAVAEELLASEAGEHPPVDDATFIATVNCLESWTTYKADDIIRLMDLVADLESAHGGARWWVSTDADADLRPELADFTFSLDPATGQPWHAALAESWSPSHEIRTLVNALNMAGIICVQSTTGMRISEVCGLNALPGPGGSFPTCVEIQSSACGTFDIFLICGRLFKTESQWTDEKWAAGLRPKGSDHVPPPIRAISVIERVFRRWRREGNVAALFLTMIARFGLPASGARIKRQSGSPVDQNGWIVEHVGITPAVRVTSHQWRKSFAQFLFRSDRRMLPSISLHFKHISLATTELYVSRDLDLLRAIDSEASRNATELLFQWATGGKPAKGPVAQMILDRCATLGHRLGNHANDEKKAEIRRIVEENGIRIWPLRRRNRQYGNCVFRPGLALCQASRIGPLLRPDATTANPELCARCSSLAVDDGHAGFWLERFAQNAFIFEHNKDTEIGVALLAKQRMEQSAMVLRWFGREFSVDDLA